MTPHCDAKVLHAPGECDICDRYSGRQRVRRHYGICFTGHEPDETNPIPCPSTQTRSVETINRWPGNRPQPKAIDKFLGDIAAQTRIVNQNAIDELLFPTCKTYQLTWRERIIALFTGEYLGEVD